MTLALQAVRHNVFGPDAGNPVVPDLLGYWAERLDPFGVPVVADRYLSGNRNSVTSIGMRMVDEHRAGGPLDVVVCAHAVPDSDPFVSLSGSYAQRYDDGALVFAVSDQGRLAPFSALRLALAYGGRVLVVALDQSSVPFADPGLADLDAGYDHAVALLLTGSGTGHLTVHCGASRNALTGFDLLIAGPYVDVPPGVPVRRAPRDQLCTAVWSVLAEELGRHRRIGVADYDPALDFLCLATVDSRPLDSQQVDTRP